MPKIMIFELTSDDARIIRRYLTRADVDMPDQDYIYNLVEKMNKFLKEVLEDSKNGR